MLLSKICAGKPRELSIDATDDSSIARRLQAVHLALAALRVPLLPNLFGVHDGRCPQVRPGARIMDGRETHQPVPPLSRGRLRSRTLSLEIDRDQFRVYDAPNHEFERSQ